MMWLFFYLFLKIIEWTFKFFTLPFRVIGAIISPKPRKPKEFKPYTFEEMYFYDQL